MCRVMRRSHLDEVDRGWSWVVLLAAFLAQLLFGGQLLSVGVFYVGFVDYHSVLAAATRPAGVTDEGAESLKGALAWPGSIMLSTMFVFAPVASSCVRKFSCRVAVMSAGIIFALGLGLSALTVHNIKLLCVSYGFMAGLGACLSFVPAVCAANENFEKHRSLAVSLTVSGAAVGSFLLPPLQVLLIEEYGLRGTLLLNAGFALNYCVFGALMFPKRKLPDGDEYLASAEKGNCLSEKHPRDLLSNESSIIAFGDKLCDSGKTNASYGHESALINTAGKNKLVTYSCTFLKMLKAELIDWKNPCFFKFMLSNILCMLVIC